MGEVHPAGICKGFERSGNAEIALDFQQGRVAAGRLDCPGGICPRGTAPVDPASLDRAASARMVISEFRLAPKQRHGRTELEAHRSLIGTALIGFGEGCAGNARGDHRRVGEDRPQHLWWHRDRDFLTDRNHGVRLSGITSLCRCIGTVASLIFLLPLMSYPGRPWSSAMTPPRESLVGRPTQISVAETSLREQST